MLTAKRPGRKIGWRKPPLAPREHDSGTVSSIERWCLDADTSPSWLYSEWAAGRGPRRIGGKDKCGKFNKVKILESPREYFERLAGEIEARAPMESIGEVSVKPSGEATDIEQLADEILAERPRPPRARPQRRVANPAVLSEALDRKQNAST